MKNEEKIGWTVCDKSCLIRKYRSMIRSYLILFLLWANLDDLTNNITTVKISKT